MALWGHISTYVRDNQWEIIRGRAKEARKEANKFSRKAENTIAIMGVSEG